MQEIKPESELVALLDKYRTLGGVIDYIFLEAQSQDTPQQLHRAAALGGMTAIDQRLEQWAANYASTEYPLETFSRIRLDAARLTGEQVPFSTFWGTDDIEPKRLCDCAWSIPNVDGYKTAFFHPPYSLRGSAGEKEDLFAAINRFVLGQAPAGVEIFSWSTDWSNYFDEGHEWWGAFFWTIRQFDTQRLVAVGASSTD